MNGGPLYRRVLGADFDNLPSAVKALHDNPGRVVAVGSCEVTRGGNPLARLMASLYGFPPAGEDVPLRVVVEVAGGFERWSRDFGGHRLRSVQGEVAGRPGLIFERFGPGRFTIDPQPSEQGLSFALKGARILGIPLPRFLWPAIVGDETRVEGRYNFDVAIALPLVGLLVSYRGELLLEG